MVRRKNKWRLIINQKGYKVWAIKTRNGFKSIMLLRLGEYNLWHIEPKKYVSGKMYMYRTYEAKNYKEALKIKNRFQKKYPKAMGIYEPSESYVKMILKRLEGK